MAAVIAASVSLLTLIGTLAAQYLARRATSRELGRTLAEQRTRTLNERFATAADKLGSDKPAAVRLAGVYAMAGLADDWPENRQTCIDILCAYLRLPYEADPGVKALVEERLAFQASREVRHTVIRIITAHLRDGALVPWRGRNFDFTGVVFDGGDFNDATFLGKVYFTGAEFSSGMVSFIRTRFSGDAYFTGARFSGGTVHFYRADFPVGANAYFNNTNFSGGEVYFKAAKFSGLVHISDAKFSGGEVNFGGAEFSGTVDFNDAEFSGSTIGFQAAKFCSIGGVSFGSAKFSGNSVVSFGSAEFSGGTVDFNNAHFSGSIVGFHSAEFSGGTVDFNHAHFSAGIVDFNHAKFSGGTLDFTDPGDWSRPPEFPWTGTPPAGVML